MQVGVMLIGCLLGFGAGAMAFFALGTGLLLSLAIWAASGPVSFFLLAAIHSLRQPRAKVRQPQQVEAA